MLKKSLCKAALTAAIIGLAGLMLASLTACSRSSSSNRCSSKKQGTHARVAEKPAFVASAVKGKDLFQQTCTTCHGLQGQGVPHLGADLQTSKFIAGSSDAQVVAMIEHGRSANNPVNTMHVAMPPKGGDPALTTQNLYDIVAFLRQIQKNTKK